MKKIQKKNLASSLIVTQANKLVEARYNLTLGEQRLIFTMISSIQPDDDDFKPYRISLKELANFLDINKNHLYEDCQKITKKLLKKVVEIKEPGRLLQTHWVSSADYIEGSGMVVLTFDPLLKPFLLKLKGNFTSSKLEMLLSFKSQYTMRMYSLLKQYERFQSREFELTQLRDILGLRQDQYVLYGNFKKDILEPTRKELKAKADLYYEFDEIKYGRSIDALRLHIFTRQIPEPAVVLPPPDEHAPNLAVEAQISTIMLELIELLPQSQKARKTILRALELYLEKYGFDYVKRNILYANAKAEKSYAGFLIQALEADWGQDWETDRNNALKTNAKPKEVWERQGYASEQEYAQAMFTKQMEAIAGASKNSTIK